MSFALLAVYPSAHVCEEFGRVTSRAYDRFRAKYSAMVLGGRKRLTPLETEVRQQAARKRYAEAARRFHAGLPELLPEELFNDELFP